jgi:uncharacterized protein (TIGR00269 family)
MAGEGCAICGAPAAVHMRYSDRRLCAPHFTEDIERRVSEAIARHRMVMPGDRIAVGLSGGKDSVALLHLLHRLVPADQGVRLVAVTVDEGISGYREETIEAAKAITASLGVEHHIVSFEELFGMTLDAAMQGGGERGCTICGIQRREALEIVARRLGATKVATGHNLDDEAQSYLMNWLRGDSTRLVRDARAEANPDFLPRIKPLQDIPEREVTLYDVIVGLYSPLPECPYASAALRSEVREMLNTLEYRYPGTLHRVVRGKQVLADLLRACPGE